MINGNDMAVLLYKNNDLYDIRNNLTYNYTNNSVPFENVYDFSLHNMELYNVDSKLFELVTLPQQSVQVEEWLKSNEIVEEYEYTDMFDDHVQKDDLYEPATSTNIYSITDVRLLYIMYSFIKTS